ncbi:DUF2345 domain-containing protein [Providencia sp. PROV132]|uniref:DUF2345 domain-containing protein n=1 Tax=Providencia sp. PROV132 TaxID=2949842 RepID=UPI00234BB39B|nr:DUF2345 domain-containing protein [Providencia sp. PROV132]
MSTRTGKLGVIEEKNPLTVQAQNNWLDIFSEQKQTITSAADIHFTGKNRIILNGGDSYLTLENGKLSMAPREIIAQSTEKGHHRAEYLTDKNGIVPSIALADFYSVLT